MSSPAPKLRWYQFSLRSMFIVVTLLAIPCGWYGMKMQQVKRQREVVAAIVKLGGRVEWLEPSGPRWMRWLLGDDLFTPPSKIFFGESGLTDDELAEFTSVLKPIDRLCLD